LFRGVYLPNGNDANFPLPFPSPFFPFPSPPLSLPSLPSLSPLPGVWSRAPSTGGPGCYPRKMEIDIGFGAFWRIFVSKRQLSSVSIFVNKN